MYQVPVIVNNAMS